MAVILYSGGEDISLLEVLPHVNRAIMRCEAQILLGSELVLFSDGNLVLGMNEAHLKVEALSVPVGLHQHVAAAYILDLVFIGHVEFSTEAR